MQLVTWKGESAAIGKSELGDNTGLEFNGDFSRKVFLSVSKEFYAASCKKGIITGKCSSDLKAHDSWILLCLAQMCDD